MEELRHEAPGRGGAADRRRPAHAALGRPHARAHGRHLAALAALCLVACSHRPKAPPAPAPLPWSDAWLTAEGSRFIDDTPARRQALLASLSNPQNSYSRQRIGSYALGDRGWDTLPVWNPRSLPLDGKLAADVTAALSAGRAPVMPAETAKLWNGARPTTKTEWIELGRRVFFGFPLRAEVFMEYALPRPELGAKVGVERMPDDGYPGLVLFDDVDGRTRVGITCAVCHTTVEHGQLIVGQARRHFDYGRLRLAYHAETHEPVDPELARRMATWGPGRADVTEDNDEDPVAVPDLWGLQAESVLTQAGTIKQLGPAALAIRQETQLLHSNHQRIRPPRELAWALTLFLYSLTPPPSRPASGPEVARGAALFAGACSGCHSNAAYGGDPVPVARVGTDAALADGGARGTGRYRPAPLLHVVAAGPYFHHGAVPTLADVLSPERLAPDYARSPLGPGPVPGHRFGTDWPAADRAAVVAYLETL